MTGRAACQHLFAADLVIDLQLIAFRLIEIAVLPLHVVDLALWPDEFFRFAVTCDTPLHLERIFLKYRRHFIDRTVARRTTDALSYVNTVIEIGVFGKIVNPFPFDRLIITKACSDRLEVWTVGPYLAVAVHAGLRRRHACRRRRLDRLVTITAIDTIVADVVLVAELNWLLLLNISPRQIR